MKEEIGEENGELMWLFLYLCFRGRGRSGLLAAGSCLLWAGSGKTSIRHAMKVSSTMHLQFWAFNIMTDTLITMWKVNSSLRAHRVTCPYTDRGRRCIGNLRSKKRIKYMHTKKKKKQDKLSVWHSHAAINMNATQTKNKTKQTSVYELRH